MQPSTVIDDISAMRDSDELLLKIAEAIATGVIPVDPAEIFQEVLADTPNADLIELRRIYLKILADQLQSYFPCSAEDLAPFFTQALFSLGVFNISIFRGKLRLLSRMGCAQNIASVISGIFPRADAATRRKVEAKIARAILVRKPLALKVGKLTIEVTLPPAATKPQNTLFWAIARCFACAALAAALFLGCLASQAEAHEDIFQTVSHDWKPRPRQEEYIQAISRSLGDKVFESRGRLGGLLTALNAKTPIDRLKITNAIWNRVAYKPDKTNWNRSDYWATPSEFLAHGGDCEDYAIAKYATLRQCGFDAADLRIMIVKDGKTKETHAILVAWVEDSPYILDNLYKNVLQPHNIQGRYAPVLSVNESSVWLHFSQKRLLAAQEEKAPAVGTARTSPAPRL